MTSDPRAAGVPRPHRLYIHLAWATLARIRAIPGRRRATIETHVLASCRRAGADPLEVCVLADRVHLLVRIPPVLGVHDLARQVRCDVEAHLARSGAVVRWTPGFAAVTVSPSEVRRARKRLASLGLDDSPRRSASAPP